MVNDFWHQSQVGWRVLAKAVRQMWNLKPAAIIEQFDLTKPQVYRKTTNYRRRPLRRGMSPELTWEKTRQSQRAL